MNIKKAFPLQWPAGTQRTQIRKKSTFKQSPYKTLADLKNQIKLMGATDLVISSNLQPKLNGDLFADDLERINPDPGIAIYFKFYINKEKKELCMCCDRYVRPWENISALARGIEALRGMERWGVSDFIERAFQGFAVKELAAAGESKAWYEILAVHKNATESEVIAAYRQLAKIHHPDAGGSKEAFQRINDAYLVAKTIFGLK